MGLEMMRLESQDELDTWQARDVEVIEELRAFMGVDLGVDEQSLDVLEAFLLHRYRTPAEALTLDQRGVLDAAARHVGLVMILAIGDAHWDIDLDNPDDAWWGLPVVRFRDGGDDCPLTAVTAALDRRTGTFLRRLVEGYVELYDTGAGDDDPH